MNKYIFHGGRSTKDVVGNKTFFQEFVSDIPDNGTVLLVYFASREDDNTDRIAHDTQKCKNAAQKNLNVIVANKDSFIEQVLVADAVYLRGGSTEKLINILKEYPEFIDSLRNKEKTVAGSSAGAYALATYFSSHYEDGVAQGLAIVPVRVITHYESEQMPPNASSVENLKNTAQELPLITLREAEWQVFCSE